MSKTVKINVDGTSLDATKATVQAGSESYDVYIVAPKKTNIKSNKAASSSTTTPAASSSTTNTGEAAAPPEPDNLNANVPENFSSMNEMFKATATKAKAIENAKKLAAKAAEPAPVVKTNASPSEVKGGKRRRHRTLRKKHLKLRRTHRKH